MTPVSAPAELASGIAIQLCGSPQRLDLSLVTAGWGGVTLLPQIGAAVGATQRRRLRYDAQTDKHKRPGIQVVASRSTSQTEVDTEVDTAWDCGCAATAPLESACGFATDKHLRPRSTHTGTWPAPRDVILPWDRSRPLTMRHDATMLDGRAERNTTSPSTHRVTTRPHISKGPGRCYC
jgi:hypothetical protein